MPAWRREANASIREVLGSPELDWIEWDATLPASVASLVLSAVGHPAPARERARVFGALAASAVTRAVVVDHNRPRRRMAVLGALFGLPWIPGVSPLGRWRRLAHPTARELQAAGFMVECLRLVAAERVQIVIARRGLQ